MLVLRLLWRLVVAHFGMLLLLRNSSRSGHHVSNDHLSTAVWRWFHRLLLTAGDINRNHSAQVSLNIRPNARILLVPSASAAPVNFYCFLGRFRVVFEVMVAMPPITKSTSSRSRLLKVVTAIHFHTLLLYQ